MKVMFDANIILDVFQNREPYYRDSAFCVNAALNGTIEGWIPAHVVTTFHYIIEKHANRTEARKAVEWILASFRTAPCDAALLIRACASDIPDFEDAVVAASAAREQCAFIVTRNHTDFSGSPTPAVLPAELVARFT